MAIYSDLNQTTPTTAILVEGIDSIYQSINNILSTTKGSRLFNPDFGSDLEAPLFDLMSDITSTKIFNEITSSISRWDSRISIDYTQSYVNSIYEENKYEILIVFKVKGVDEKYEYRGELLKP
jgi:phage baseplate assembly protein W